ncbi:MAG: methyltransferase domain-containing protein [Planctomycetota bacterium]
MTLAPAHPAQPNAVGSGPAANPANPDTLAELLAREAEHFDRHYADEAAAGVAPLSAADRVRYTAPPARTIYPREDYHRRLASTAAPGPAKRILEIACGNGIDASILAHNGAEVYAYDLSSESVELTLRRAQVNGVSDRVHATQASDLDRAFPEEEPFDHVVGYAALHHLPDMLALAHQAAQRVKPGGSVVFTEPVVNSRLLLGLRNLVPLRIDPATDDEVPLTEPDVRRFAQAFHDAGGSHATGATAPDAGPARGYDARYFQIASRIWRFWPDRARLCAGLHRADAWLQAACPPAWRLATVCVFECRKPG